MMKQELTDKEPMQTVRIYRYVYTLFLLLVVYLLLRGDLENATINLGIALIFDPFDAKVKWQDRPLYQKVWLLVHLGLTLAGFLYLIIR
ncbi:MAG TPA: hypothetical protein VM935_01890 [Chitinophagaceae bacterium]|jgi:hypothetical protein|nr:hypothetical protein [Chitinophagaceae bacterium]